MSANSGELRIQQIAHQIKQPIFIRATIRIGERNDVARGCLDSCVSCDGQSEIRSVFDITNVRKLLGDLFGAIG